MITTNDLKYFLKDCSINDEIFIDTDYCSLVGRIKDISKALIWVDIGITRDESVMISCEDINTIYKVVDVETQDRIINRKEKLLQDICDDHNIPMYDDDGERINDNIILYQLAQIWSSLIDYEKEIIYYVFGLDKDFFTLMFQKVRE